MFRLAGVSENAVRKHMSVTVTETVLIEFLKERFPSEVISLYASPMEREEDQVKSLSKALREMMRKELLDVKNNETI